jgi:hypothetical protein
MLKYQKVAEYIYRLLGSIIVGGVAAAIFSDLGLMTNFYILLGQMSEHDMM